MAQWLFESEFGGQLRDALLHSPLVRDGWLDGAVLREYLDDHFSRRRDRGSQLWTLFNLTLWYRRWILGEHVG